ncbi:MAG: RNA polymerase sporulation sigma factor SigH [Nitriliruptorales bacterium]
MARDRFGRSREPAGVSNTDEELVVAVRGGDDTALVELLERYKRFVRAKARSYFLIGADREDLVQEGMIGLDKAIRDYASGHQTSFRSFAELCITRQILTAIKGATRQKHLPLNSYVSFDRPRDDDPERTVGDTFVAGPDSDPLDLLVASDDLEHLNKIFNELFSGLEGDVVKLFVEGRSYQEIADVLGRHVKSVDNALQRVKRKLEQHLQERER